MLRDDAIREGLIDATEEDTKRMNLGPADFAMIKERKAANAAAKPESVADQVKAGVAAGIAAAAAAPTPTGAAAADDKTAKHGK